MSQGNVYQWSLSLPASLLSWIHLPQVDTAVGERDVKRDLRHPTRRNMSIYWLHLHCQRILQGDREDETATAIKNLLPWKQPCRCCVIQWPFQDGCWATSAPLLQLLWWLSVDCTMCQRVQARLQQESPGAEGSGEDEKNSCLFSTSTTANFVLQPSSHSKWHILSSSVPLFNSQTRIIYWKIVKFWK